MSNSVLELPRLSNEVKTFERRPSGVVRALPPTQSTTGHEFTEEELNSLQRDDQMAAGMISVILGIAFSVLLCLVIGVCAWTALGAG